MMRLFFSLLHQNQLVEFDDLQVVLVYEFVGWGEEVVILHHIDFLVVRNNGLVVILAQLVDLSKCFSDEEEGLFSVEFLLFVDKGKNEYVELLRSVIHL